MRVVFSVRSARSAGPGPKRLRNTVSVSSAARIAFFQFMCTGDSADETMRVPICTPSAPSVKAAAMVRPSTMPPAAIIGTSTFSQHQRQQHHRRHSRGFLKPPPSPPSTTRPSTPASIARNAVFSVGTTWNTVRPASLSWRQIFRGSPAEVVTNFTPWSTMNFDDAGIAHEGVGDVHPERLVGQLAHLGDLLLDASSSPDEVSMMPMPPAFETAEASWARAIQPIGAWTIGILDAEHLGDAVLDWHVSSPVAISQL